MFPKVVLSKAVSPCLAMHCEVWSLVISVYKKVGLPRQLWD
jgi:hypothetical protein